VIGNKRVLAVIPARGGSKGLPGKNILPVAGRPLLDWTVCAARDSRSIDRTVLSSDDDLIIEAGRRLGCDVPFKRPPELATDSAGTVDVVLHALEMAPGYDVVVVLQPTSPLRTAQDIDVACARWAESGAPSCVSVSPVTQSPYWMYRMDSAQRLEPLLSEPSSASRRQDLPEVVALNGAIYVADAAWLRATRRFVTNNTVAYVMPPERALDIDTAADFEAFVKAIQEETHA
jgi:N-acylneuraminate cytidylyltransferase